MVFFDGLLPTWFEKPSKYMYLYVFMFLGFLLGLSSLKYDDYKVL